MNNRPTWLDSIGFFYIVRRFIPWAIFLVLFLPLCLEWNNGCIPLQKTVAVYCCKHVTVTGDIHWTTWAMFSEQCHRVCDICQSPLSAYCTCDLLFHFKHSKMNIISMTKYHTALITAISKVSATAISEKTLKSTLKLAFSTTHVYLQPSIQ